MGHEGVKQAPEQDLKGGAGTRGTPECPVCENKNSEEF